MLEKLHRVGSTIRHSGLLAGENQFWRQLEVYWQKIFERLSAKRGFSTHINNDIFKLTYEYAARYDRYDQRAYERVFYKAFVQRIEKGMIVLDIGAHIGIFTLGAATRVGKEGRVYAFEPAPETAEILEHHIALNGMQDRVEVVKAAITDFNGTIPFYVYGSSMAASLDRRNVEDLNPENHDAPSFEIIVPALKLDQFCEEGNIKPDILKIDAEGAELNILYGAKQLLKNHPLSIMCEIHPKQMQSCGASKHELHRYLDSIGYSLKPISEPNEHGIFHSHIARRKD